MKKEDTQITSEAIESAFESIRKPTGRMPEEVAQSIREQIQALVDAKEDPVIR